MSVNKNSKPPHADEGIAGRMPDNKNSKSPHAAKGISGRVSVFDIKAEWFFHETRSGARQQWAEDRKASRPKLRDPDFLAENAARYSIPPSAGSHEDSLGRGGRLHKEGGTRLHHAFGSTHVAPYRKAARRIRGRQAGDRPLVDVHSSRPSVAPTAKYSEASQHCSRRASRSLRTSRTRSGSI